MVGFVGVWEAKKGEKQRSTKAEKQRGKETEKQRSKEVKKQGRRKKTWEQTSKNLSQKTKNT